MISWTRSTYRSTWLKSLFDFLLELFPVKTIYIVFFEIKGVYTNVDRTFIDQK